MLPVLRGYRGFSADDFGAPIGFLNVDHNVYVIATNYTKGGRICVVAARKIKMNGLNQVAHIQAQATADYAFALNRLLIRLSGL